MAIKLYEHNQVAYERAKSLLETEGKAAIVHPTGTGKSFIAFKLCEENPDRKILWLSPSEYIFKTQLENLKSTSDGYAPDNIVFYTYAKLTYLSDGEIEEIKPDYIVLDEFHRCGAEVWGKGVQKILTTYADVPVLGLSATNIRYLDNQRDMADELFEGNIASEMTLGEAIVRGILNPPKYVLSVYSYQKELERYKHRIKRAKSKAVRDEGERYFEALRRALDKADGIEEIFRKHIADTTGKYIVFCANYGHLLEMTEKVPEWFEDIDKNPHIYTAYSDDPETSKEFAAFKADNSGHLKLLFCIDMLNEGIHVEDVSGVILLRPTVSPIIYKQQIGRALSASKKNDAVIFDIVLNIENLYSIGAIEDEMQIATAYYRSHGESEKIINERFKVVDEVRDCIALFGKLNETLTASWDLMYDYAKGYFQKYKNLEVPKRYKTSEGYSLGTWLQTQRKVRAGEQYGNLDENRIKKLDEIGMVWGSYRDLSWERYYAEAKKYYNEHGDLNTKVTDVTENGTDLGAWICRLRSYRKSGAQQNYLTKERIAALDEIGMLWSVPDYLWEENFGAAMQFYKENGHLDIPVAYVAENGLKVGTWVRRQRNLRNGKAVGAELTDEQIARLDSIGMIWKNKIETAWENGYREAKKYFERYGNLDVAVSYVTENGFKLGGWIADRREQARAGKLTGEKIKLLDGIGMIWQKADPWEIRYSLVKAYYEEHGNLLIPSKYKADGIWISKWLNEQRQIYIGNRGKQKLTDDQIKRLECIGMVWENRSKIRSTNAWERMFHAVREYFEQNGNICIPTDYRTKEGKNLSAWLAVQRRYYKNGKLNGEQIAKLNSVGMVWTFEDPWETGFEHAKQYFQKNGDLRVNYKYVSPDGYALGSWIANQRNNYDSKDKYRKLDKDRIARLEAIGMIWKIKDIQWNEAYARAKRYYRKHKNLAVQKGRKDNDSYDLYEWVRIQREKYRTGELTARQIELMEQIGMDWLTTVERNWETNYKSAERYYKKYGSIEKMPCTYVDEDGFPLGMWLWRIRKNKVKLKTSGANGNQVERLAKIGFVI